MAQNEKPPRNPLKKAHKVFKFWYKAMLSTDLMNETKDRIELQQALETIKDYAKKA